jgi:uncharacterized protein (TIGR02646 family)
MRQLRRPQYTVPTMADSGPGGQRRLSDRRKYEQTGSVPASFTPHWTKADVKGLLHSMQGRVCAYCGMRTNGLDVDHFRPKGGIADDQAHGGYWWLACDCSNYFLGCTVCNQTRKRTSFPLLPGAARCTYYTRDTIATEKRALLDPAEDPLEEWLTIAPDDVTGRLIANPNLNPTDRSRVQDAIELFGLNVDAEVRSQRSKAYEEACRAATNKQWDELRQSAMRHCPHSLAARIVLQRAAPEHLPGAEEEMKDLANSLWEELRTLVREIQNLRARSKPIRPVDERQLRALGWALIILRTDPPAGDPATADAYLVELLKREEAEIRVEIVDLFRALLAEQ